jgi:hypothetical protein
VPPPCLLVLAATEYYLPLYREVNTYPHLVGEVIPGTPQLRNDEELHAHDWKLVESLFDQQRVWAIVQYRNLMGTGRASDQFVEIVLAAATFRS